MLIDNVLQLNTPDNPLPLVFDSPHSGRIYPIDFNYACDFDVLQRAEDHYVDELFADAPYYRAALLTALFPRSYIDVNRAIDDIDPALYDGVWPLEDDITPRPSNRSYAGIGLIRRLVKPGEPVYDQQLTPKAIKSRIKTYYKPYHETLGDILDKTHYRYGQVWHVNCHSMPSRRASHTKTFEMARANPKIMPDFVLGNRDGTTCDIGFTHAVRDFITSLGYKVAINDPYKGVELVEKYSDPARGRHSLQIEISKRLYLNEQTGKKSKNFSNLKEDITKLIEFCASYAQSNLTKRAAD